MTARSIAVPMPSLIFRAPICMALPMMLRMWVVGLVSMEVYRQKLAFSMKVLGIWSAMEVVMASHAAARSASVSAIR